MTNPQTPHKSPRPPAVNSAAAVAAALSRRLRAAGFAMADTSDKYRWTEGVYVRRVGVGRSVTVDYHVPHHVPAAETRTRAREKRAELRAWLVAHNYPLDPNTSGVWVLCERE